MIDNHEVVANRRFPLAASAETIAKDAGLSPKGQFVSLNGRDCFVKTAPNDMPEILLPKKENLNGAI
jgi:hypothetical protein